MTTFPGKTNNWRKKKLVKRQLSPTLLYSPNEDSRKDDHRRRNKICSLPINCTCACSFLGGLALIILLIMAILIPIMIALSKSATEVSSTRTPSDTTQLTLTTTSATSAIVATATVATATVATATTTAAATATIIVATATSATTTTAATTATATVATATTTAATATTGISATETLTTTTTSATTATSCGTSGTACTSCTSSCSSGLLLMLNEANSSVWTTFLTYQYTWLAPSTTSATIQFQFYTSSSNNYWDLDNISVKDSFSTELLTNGGFNSTVSPWILTCGMNSCGSIQNYGPSSSSDFYVGCISTTTHYSISQTFITVPCASYNISFQIARYKSNTNAANAYVYIY